MANIVLYSGETKNFILLWALLNIFSKIIANSLTSQKTVPENFTKGHVAKRQSKIQQNYAHWNRNADYCLRLPGLN